MILSLQINPTLGLWFLLAYFIGVVVVVKAFKVRMPFTFKAALRFVLGWFKRKKET